MKNKNKLLVIGVYPIRGKSHAKKTYACAPYTKDTLLSMIKTSDSLDVTVLGNIVDSKNSYKENGIKVKRIWKDNSFLIFPKLFKEIFLNHKDTEKVLIEFEIMIFGKVFYLTPLPFFNIALRLIGKDITFVCHQVIRDIGDFEGHVNINKKSLKKKSLNLIISLFYRSIILSVNKMIVFDEELKKTLTNLGGKSKTKVIPLSFKPLETNITREKAREKLSLKENDFAIVCFGYIAWYKGTDWIIEAYKRLKKVNDGKNIKLIIAGGSGVNNREKTFYKNYLAKIEKQAAENNILITGFIEEKDIPIYYQAADLTVYPYRIQMSSSGPLSIAYSFKKPVLVSKRLEKIFETSDIKNILETKNINLDDLTFKLNYKDFSKKITDIIRNPIKLELLENISSDLSKERSWEKIGELHYAEIFEEKSEFNFFRNFKYIFSRS